jgi:hypothetical protein
MFLLVASGLVGAGIAVAYATVLANVGGGFPLRAPPASSAYVDSPYWVGLPRATAAALVVFQAGAAAGYVMWLVYVHQHPPTRGLLQDRRWLHGAVLVFLAASAAWPFGAYRAVQHPDSLAWALAACAPLWLAAAGVVVLVGGTFEAAYPSAVPAVGILLLANVVVLADGCGWAAAAIFRSLHHNDT